MKDLREIMKAGLSGIGMIFGGILALVLLLAGVNILLRPIPLLIIIFAFFYWKNKKNGSDQNNISPDQNHQDNKPGPVQNTAAGPAQPARQPAPPVQPAVPVKPKPVFTPDLNFEHAAAPQPLKPVSVRKLKNRQEFREMEKQMLFK